MRELTRDRPSTSTSLRDSALSTTADVLRLGFALGLLLAELDVATLSAVFSELLLANEGDDEFLGLAVQAVTEAAGEICAAAAGEARGVTARRRARSSSSSDLYAVESAAFDISCALLDAIAAGTTWVATGPSTTVLLGVRSPHGTAGPVQTPHNKRPAPPPPKGAVKCHKAPHNTSRG